MTECLETPRLLLRVPEAHEATDIMVLANNRKVAAMLAQMPHPYRFADAEGWIAAARAVERSADRRSYGIYLKERKPTYIGGCGAGPFGRETVSHLGYWIGEPYWGKGYATEAARAVLDHAFRVLGRAEVHSGAQVTNHLSRKILEKLGFRHQGCGTIFAPARKRFEPIDRFILKRSDWEETAGTRS